MVQSLYAYLKAGTVLLFLVLAFIVACNGWVIYSTQHFIFRQVNSLPVREVGLVLGTSKKVMGGQENLFFRHRMEAAATLYHQKKVRYLILSGDNSSQYYNEPSDMKAALLKRGVPEDAMTLDYAGHNTFASVLRVKRLFNQDSITIISQSVPHGPGPVHQPPLPDSGHCLCRRRRTRGLRLPHDAARVPGPAQSPHGHLPAQQRPGAVRGGTGVGTVAFSFQNLTTFHPGFTHLEPAHPTFGEKTAPGSFLTGSLTATAPRKHLRHQSIHPIQA
jgi:hypothetical protein